MSSQVDVPLEVVHLTDEYWNNVVSVLSFDNPSHSVGAIFFVLGFLVFYFNYLICIWFTQAIFLFFLFLPI